MPNWCENQLTISGDPAELQRFIAQATKTHGGWVTDYSSSELTREYREDLPGFFWNFVSPPVEAQTPEDYFGNTSDSPHYWYYWNTDNWGTKWDVPLDSDLFTADRFVTTDGVTSFEVIFDTAWGPAIGAYQAMSSQYPTLTVSVEYSEEGMCFWGSVVFENGEVVSEEEGEIDHDWLVERYGECPEIAWGHLAEGETCEQCGATYTLVPFESLSTE